MSIVRDLTLKLEKYLAQDDILLVIGARQVGKTTVLHQLEDGIRSRGQVSYFLDLEDPDYLAALNQSPKNLLKIFPFNLKARNFLFIDEIQYLAEPSHFLKYIFDEYKGKIKIIASGSSAFYLDRKFKDSLAGRKKIFHLYGLSFREFLRFKNEADLSRKDFSNPSLSEKEKIILYYQEYLSFGGYPRAVLATQEEKEGILRDILYSYVKKDIYEANIRQDEIFYKLFKILAAQVGGLVNSSELASTLGVSKTSVDNYLYVMQKSFHIALVKPFFKNIRKELTKMPKVFFLDLGLRNFLTGNLGLYRGRQDRGALLENALYRQLLEKYDAEEIKFWRTVQKKEVDFVIKDAFAFEVKAQASRVKLKDYQVFLENYPAIKFNFASFDVPEKKIGKYPVLEIWQV